jgi:hypothetical protein
METDSQEPLRFGRVLRQELTANGTLIEALEVQVAGNPNAATRLRVQLAIKVQNTWKALRSRTVRVKAGRAYQVVRMPFPRAAKVKLGDRIAVSLRAREAYDVPPSAWVNSEFQRPELALVSGDVPLGGTLQMTLRYARKTGPLALLLPQLVRRVTVLMRPRERAVFALAWLAVGLGSAWLIWACTRDVASVPKGRPPH